MNIQFIEYPPCSTCRKAKKQLQKHAIDFTPRHIVEDTPSVEELRSWKKQFDIELKKFFNTSGNVYKGLHLKDTLPSMSDEELLQLLASNGMLIKRPLLVSDDQIIIGFNEENYEKLCSQC